MQQKALTTPPPNCAPGVSVPFDTMASSLDEYSDSSTLSEPSSVVPLRSALKRSGRRSRGFRVSINESLNEVVDSDYVILLQENEQPQLVSVKALDLSNLSSVPASIDIVTLSPPDGYKDCFGRALSAELNDDSDNECDDARKDWYMKAHDPLCPHANLPDLLSPNKSTSNSVADGRFRTKHLKPSENHKGNDAPEYFSGLTGILKGGKLWKSGDKNYARYDVNREGKRSVRFSDRDEYNLDDIYSLVSDLHSGNSHSDIITTHSGLPQMNPMLGRNVEDWHIEMDGVNVSKYEDNSLHFADSGQFSVTHTCPKHGKFINEQSLEEEQIRESIQRYEEMRRRVALAETRNNSSIDQSKEYIDNQVSDLSSAESRIRRIENSEAAHIAGTVIRSNNEVRRAIERNTLRRSLIRFSDARKKDSNKNDKGEKHESSLIEKLKWLTTEDATNGNAQKRKNESAEEMADEGKCKELTREDSLVFHTIEQYRRLAEMFNKSTSSRVGEYVPEAKDWQKEPEPITVEPERIGDFGEDLSITLSYAPAAATDQVNEEDIDKLIYSGGVRYTKEGTLPHARKSAQKNLHNHPKALVNGCCPEEADEGLSEDKTSSLNSSQSSPRYPVKGDSEIASTVESGYSSNELSTESSSHDPNDAHGPSDCTKKSTTDNYVGNAEDLDDHGFSRRPSVRGVKTRQNSFNKDLQTHRNAMCTHPTKLSISKCNHLEQGSKSSTEEMVCSKSACSRLNTKPEVDHPLENQRSSYGQPDYNGLSAQNPLNQPSFNGSGVVLDSQNITLDRESLLRESSLQRVHLNSQVYQTQHFNNMSQIMPSPSDARFSSGLGETSNSSSEFHHLTGEDQGQFVNHSTGYDPAYASHSHCEFPPEMEVIYQNAPINMQLPYEDINQLHFQSHNCNHELKKPSLPPHQCSQELSPCGNHVFSQVNNKLSPVQHSTAMPTLPNDTRKLTSCMHTKKELFPQYADKSLSSWHQQGQMPVHNFNQNNMSSLPPAIISSHNSYTTPILPEGTMDKAPCIPMIRGMLSSEELKYSLELNNCIYKPSDPSMGDLNMKPLAMNNVN